MRAGVCVPGSADAGAIDGGAANDAGDSLDASAPRDSGGSSDSGSAGGTDARVLPDGGSGTSAGGCCAVIGGRDPRAAIGLVLVVLAALGWRRQR